MGLLGKVLLGLYIATRATDFSAGQTRATAGYYVRDVTTPQTAARVAIIPFDNLSDDTQADRKILGIMVTHVLSTKTISVVEPSVVESTLADLRLRPPLSSIQAKQLAAKLGTRLLMVGTITEYGQARGASPSLTVALNARIVDTGTDSIVWAAASNRTGRPDDSLFGSGLPPSLTKLTHQTVDQLVKLMLKAQKAIIQSSGPALPVPDAQGGTAPADAGGTAGGGGAANPAPPAVANRLTDETMTYTPNDLIALLPPRLGGANKSEVNDTGNCVSSVDATYMADTTPMRIRLTDQLKVADATAVAAARAGESTKSTIEGMPAFTESMPFGSIHVYVAAGRFTFSVDGPAEEAELVNKVAAAMVKALQVAELK